MQDHIHLCIRKHKDLAEEMIKNMQHASAELLRARTLRAPEHPVWAFGGWKVFLDEPADIERTISYINRNPIKHRLARREFPFVTPYDGWPLRKTSPRG
jgi:REP element-mobilizing transposase RayT